MWRVGGVARLADVATRRLYWRHQYIRFFIDLSAWTIGGESLAHGVEARQGTFEELRRFRAIRPGLPLQFHADLTHGARRFYVGLVAGEIGHISWLYTHDDDIPQMRLKTGEIMLEGAYTLPECRGQGLLTAVQRAALDDAAREGLCAAYTHVAVDNRASIRGVRKTGFRPVGILDWRTVLGVSVTRYVDSPALAATVGSAEVDKASPVGA